MAEQKQKEWWQQTRWWVMGAGILLVLILADVVAAFTLPPRSVSYVATATAADQLRAEADLRSSILSLLNALTPLLALIAGIAALLNFQETRRQNLASLEVTHRGQVTDRFSKAIQQLGEPNLDVRIGGIYALEQIAQESPQLHWPIMEVLIAFLHEHASETLGANAPAGRADFHAIGKVIGRRNVEHDASHADLRLAGVDLRSADLRNAHFERAFLGRVHLEQSSAPEAHFEGAQLPGTYLNPSWLPGAHFEKATFLDTHLEGARLTDAHLEGAYFVGAHLAGAELEGAHLQQTVFVRGTDLSPTHGLTQAQLDSAICDDTIKAPLGLTIRATISLSGEAAFGPLLASLDEYTKADVSRTDTRTSARDEGIIPQHDSPTSDK